MSNIPESLIQKGVIARSSFQDFREIFERISEEEILEKNIKVQAENRVQWFKIIIKNVYDDHHQILKTVGIVDDITEQKLQEELL